ncbi:craniofacial development protein 2-like [Centruroides vittatus]|uniref:craniofacial development protein 2-like n=1 Tax=Centruroides vittatus TaxID=120091 RepID=UPI00350F115D
MNLACYNCRSLSSEPRLQELEEELLKIKWDVIGLSEVRRKGEGQIQLKSGHIFYYRGTENGKNSGVCFIINKRWKDNILEVDSSSDRVARLVLRLSKRNKLQIIQVYAPTASHPDEEIEDFYDEIKQMNGKGKHYVKIIMGDFNARIGAKEKNETSVGKFGHGKRNERGDMLVDFAEAEKFYIMNSFFKKKSSRKWTWRHPNGGKYESDYILSNKQHNVENCNVLNRFNTGSDHRLVRGRLHLNTRLERRKLMRTTKSVDLKNLKEQHGTFEMELKNQFSVLENLTKEETDISETNRQITKIIMETAARIGGYVIRKTEKKITEKTRQLMGKRRMMKRSKENITSNIEYAELCKTIRKCFTEDIRKYNCGLVKTALENNKSLRNAKQQLTNGRKHIFALKKEDGTVTRDREEILARVEEFYKKLYARDTAPTVKTTYEVTNEVPEILKEEVAYAIRNMKKGKAPGEDGITIDILRGSWRSY